jgi:hypothetical protein
MEKKLNKESGSRKSGSLRPSDEKIKSISVSRHHHHSPRNSNEKSHISSSPSPVRKHKRSGVDELRGEITKSNLLCLMVSTRRMKMQRHGFWA